MCISIYIHTHNIYIYIYIYIHTHAYILCLHYHALGSVTKSAPKHKSQSGNICTAAQKRLLCVHPFELFQTTQLQAKENVWEATCLPRQSAHVIEGTLVNTVHASTDKGWESSLLLVDYTELYRVSRKLRSWKEGLTCPASSSKSASSGSSASGSPHHHWVSTVHGAEPRRQHRASSPSHGSDRAGSACRPRWGTHDAPETSEHC